MKVPFIFIGILLLANAAEQQNEGSDPQGTIYGVVISQHEGPTKGLTLTAQPWGVAVNGVLPRTTTNDAGEYRFKKLSRWGRYIVYADDENAGYSRTSTGPIGGTQPPEVEITPEHPEGELNLYLPPKAGSIRIHLTSRRTGSAIHQMTVWVSLMEKSDPRLFTMDSYSDHDVLVPPDENLLLHVKSDGFREWDESAGTGKPINVPTGSVLTLNVQLDPAE